MATVNPMVSKQLCLLNGFALIGERGVVPVPPSVRRLIALIGIRGCCGRTEVAGLLWPQVRENHARASLRTALWRVRQLNAALIVDQDDTIALTPQVDITDYRNAAKQLLNGSSCATVPPASLITTGDLLPGWYEDWVLFERERFRQLRMHALEVLARRLAAEEDYTNAVDAALAAIQLEPLRESATRTLIEVHLAEKNLIEAVRCLNLFTTAIHEELNAEPSMELIQLVRRAGAQLTDQVARSRIRPVR